MLKKIKKFIPQDYVIAIFLFLLAGFARTIPEIIAGKWPIGYDTFNTYAAELSTYHGPLINWLKTANLLYFIFLPFVRMGVEPASLMKFFGPILYGGLIVSFYFFIRNFLRLGKLQSFLAGIILVLQLAALRLSWDLYRNELGLIFLFLALINLAKVEKTKNFILFCLLALLVVLTNEIVTVILFVALLVYLVALFFKKKKSYLTIIKLSALFVMMAFLFFGIINQSARQVLYSDHIYFVSEKNNLWRYLYQYKTEMDYGKLYSIISRLFWLLYGFLIPFILIGFWFWRKNIILTTIALWLLIGSFSSLIFAGTGLIVWERWLIMLVFPFVIYTTEGIFQIGRFVDLRFKKWHFHLRPMLLTLAIIFWLGFLGLFAWRAYPFLTKSYPDTKPPYRDEEMNSYFTPTMVHNSVGIWRIEDTLNTVEWLDKNVPLNAVVLVDNRYRGLMMTNFKMDNRYIITNTWSERWSQEGLNSARKKGFTKIYLIWKNTSVKGFDRIFVSGNVAVYKAKPPR